MNKKSLLSIFSFVVIAVFARSGAGQVPVVGKREVSIAAGDPAGLLLQAPGFTRYAKIESLFKAGTLPSREELSGWHAGRCYSESDRDAALAGLMAGLSLGHDGPLFPDEFKAFSITTYADPSAFDEPSQYGSFSTYSEMMRSIYNDVTFARVKDGSYAARQKLSEPYYRFSLLKGGTIEHRIRKAGSYFIIQHAVISVPKDREWVGAKPGQILSYCYFFKKIKD
ncbi:MAG: hypothetical protein HY921_08215 [Elusimicrobia bacterium]|nr:hypothetical protein [Elusimicrobiota bacterium]